MERLPSRHAVGPKLALAAALLLSLASFIPVASAQAGGFQIDVEGAGAAPASEPDQDSSAEASAAASAETQNADSELTPAQVSDGEDAQARALFEAGTAYYERGEYHEAYGQFVRAYEISRRPVLMYNASQAAERAGDIEQAIRWLERFIEAPDADQAERDRQRPRLANLRHRLASERAHEHGEEERHGFFMPVPAFIAYLVGGAGLLTFATFGILTLNEDNSLSDRCATRPCSSSDLSDLHTFSRAADAGWIIGVAGVVTGSVLWLTLKGDSSEHGGVAFEPWLSPSLVGAGARLRF